MSFEYCDTYSKSALLVEGGSIARLIRALNLKRSVVVAVHKAFESLSRLWLAFFLPSDEILQAFLRLFSRLLLFEFLNMVHNFLFILFCRLKYVEKVVFVLEPRVIESFLRRVTRLRVHSHELSDELLGSL